MSTSWNNEPKRQVGNEITLMDDTVAVFNSTTVLMAGANPPTTWTNEVKTS